MILYSNSFVKEIGVFISVGVISLQEFHVSFHNFGTSGNAIPKTIVN